MDLFNVGTKGMSTKKGVESFDKMLVDLGYNPNELTTKQKVSMMKRGKGLIQKNKKIDNCKINCIFVF